MTDYKLYLSQYIRNSLLDNQLRIVCSLCPYKFGLESLDKLECTTDFHRTHSNHQGINLHKFLGDWCRHSICSIFLCQTMGRLHSIH